MKLYPFSMKHAHDIEFYRNRLFNTMRDMENGEIPFDKDRYNRIADFYDGELLELYEAVLNSRDGRVSYLNGKQIGLAKRIVFWASEERAARLIESGRMTQDVTYC